MLKLLLKATKISIYSGSSDNNNDSLEHRSSRSNQGGDHSGHRLVRTHRIQGLRHVDDDPSNDASRSSLFSIESSSKTASVSTWDSRTPSPSGRCPSHDVTDFPEPPLSLNGRHSAQDDLSVSSSRSSDCNLSDDDEIAGDSSDSASSDGSFKSCASSGVLSAVTRLFEGDLQNLPGTHIRSPAQFTDGLRRLDQGYGGGLQILTHVRKSAPNSTCTSPISSPKLWGSKESPLPWSSASNNMQQGCSLTFLGLNHEKSTLVNAHPVPQSPVFFPPRHPPRSSAVAPLGSNKTDTRLTVCKWKRGRLLGRGAAGKVYKGIHCETGEFCAIKQVKYVEGDPRSKEVAKQLEQEITLLSSLRHPNIVHYKGSEIAKKYINIHLELVTEGSIYKLCREFKKLEEPVVRRYTRQILHGLAFLHSRNTVHRDIKGANILIDREGTVKLADFGLAKQFQRGAKFSFKGTPRYMAPEVIMKWSTGFECAIDIWSLGCTVLEMATGEPPWSGYEQAAAMVKGARAEIPPFPPNLSLEGQSFIKRCLQLNAADRPSAEELLQDPFVQIPNDRPDYMSSGVEERSTTQQESGSSIGMLRAELTCCCTKGDSGRSRQGTCPSCSAPVSPQSSHNFMNEPSSAGLSPSPGFPTPPGAPPPGSPRGTEFSTSSGGSPSGTGFSRSPAGTPRVTEVDFYKNREKSSYVTDINVVREPHIN